MNIFSLISEICKAKEGEICNKSRDKACGKENCSYLRRYPILKLLEEKITIGYTDKEEKKILCICNTCNNKYGYTLQQLADFSINDFKFFRSDRHACCGFTYKERYGSVAYNIIPRHIYDENGKEFYLVTHHEAICDKGHKFLIKKDLKNPKCKICESEEKFEFFKVLKSFNMEYKVVEIYGNFNGKCRDNKNMKELKNCVIGVYNESKSIAGRIIFNDIIGSKPVKIKNKLPIVWFDDYTKLNDIEYCKDFLSTFFNEMKK